MTGGSVGDVWSHVSPNCDAYTSVVSSIVASTVSVKGSSNPMCNVRLDPVMSCQNESLENPDEATMTQMKSRARRMLEEKGCQVGDNQELEVNHKIVQVGTRNPEFSGEELVARGSVSNCAAVHNDLNEFNFIAQATAFPTASMTRISDGKTVTSFKKRLNASLYACDISDAAMPQVMEDLRKVAAHSLVEQGYRVNPIDLELSVSVLPMRM